MMKKWKYALMVAAAALVMPTFASRAEMPSIGMPNPLVEYKTYHALAEATDSRPLFLPKGTLLAGQCHLTDYIAIGGKLSVPVAWSGATAPLTHAPAQLVQGAAAVGSGCFVPVLQPGILRLLCLHAGTVADHKEDEELVVQSVVEDGLKVELDHALTRHTAVIAQEAPPESVGHEAVEVLVTDVEQKLHKAVRRHPRRSHRAGRLAVQVQPAPDLVDGHVKRVIIFVLNG